MFIIEQNGSFSIAMSSTTGRYISKNGAEFGDVDGFHIPHFQNGHEASMIARSQYLPSFGASSRSDQLWEHLNLTSGPAYRSTNLVLFLLLYPGFVTKGFNWDPVIATVGVSKAVGAERWRQGFGQQC